VGERLPLSSGLAGLGLRAGQAWPRALERGDLGLFSRGRPSGPVRGAGEPIALGGIYLGGEGRERVRGEGRP